MSRPGVLLDRDGTVIVDSGYVGSVDRVEFLEGSIEAIAELNSAGMPVAILTNQAGVARGFYTIADVRAVHSHIDVALARQGAHVDLWLYCPYHPEGVVEEFARHSLDRKPEPGMAIAAARALDLDLSASWVVGDSPADVGLARAIGAVPILIGPSKDTTVCSVGDLRSAVQHILGTDIPTNHTTRSRDMRFPKVHYDSATLFARDYTEEMVRALGTISFGELDRAAEILNAAYDRDAAVFACGNGGSASIANHLQCDHVKGVRTGTNLHTRVFSLSTNVELLSAIANDIGYGAVFEYQLQSQARPGDVLVVVSSSGRSPNIVRALEWAAANDVQSIALTGFDGVPARDLATASIHVNSMNYGIVEDLHQACMHLLAQYVRQTPMAHETVASEVF